MADGEKSKPKQNPKVLVEKAIPKIASALHSMISKSKNTNFQERCLLKAQVSHTDDLTERFESKLWEIAKHRMGVSRSSDDGTVNADQIVPHSNDTSQTSKGINPEEVLRKSQQSTACTYAEDPFDDLAFFDVDHTHPDINDSFYEQEEVLITPGTRDLNALHTLSKVSSQAGISQECAAPHASQIDLLQTVKSKDDWLNDFAYDSYWIDKNQDDDDDDVQIVGISQRDHNKSPSTCSRKKTAATDHPDIHRNTSQYEPTKSPHAHIHIELHENSQTHSLKQTAGSPSSSSSSSSENLEATPLDNSDCGEVHTALSNDQSLSSVNGTDELQCIHKTGKGTISDAASHEVSGLYGQEKVLQDEWSSFYENNNLIDDFDALADLFDV